MTNLDSLHFHNLCVIFNQTVLVGPNDTKILNNGTDLIKRFLIQTKTGPNFCIFRDFSALNL